VNLPAFLALAPDVARWSDRLNGVQRFLRPLVGDWTEADLVPGLTGLQAVLGTLLLLVTLIALAIVRAAARRVAEKRQKTGGASDSWFRMLLCDATAPILLAIGVLGIYAAVSVIAFRLPNSGETILTVAGGLRTIGLTGALFWFLFRVTNVIELELNRWAGRTTRRWDNVLSSVVVRALRLFIPLVGVLLIVPTLDLPTNWHDGIQTAASLILIGAVGFILVQLVNTAEQATVDTYKVDTADNLEARKVQTQVRILKRIVVALILTVTVACMLTVFAPVRTLGHSILASAGVAGIVLGIAAQRTLGVFLAGIQIAFTQPIRMDDVVIVEGEWGKIEEITLTYVVVALWDNRRMVVPITYFVEKPFQNWTRASAELLGSVMLYVDYTVPVDALRQELDRILQTSSKWDGKVKGLQVTDAKEQTMEVRVLASAADSGRAIDLRCEIREKMIDYIRSE
jgi:small-conductance mechanosensitive channel